MTGPTGPEDQEEVVKPATRRARVVPIDTQRTNGRIEMLKRNGAASWLVSDPKVVVALADGPLSDDDMVASWLESLAEIDANKAIEKFKTHNDSYQKAAFNALHSSTQEFLKSYGYQLPHDHLNWWNPGDWAQLGQKYTGFSGKSAVGKAVTAPGWVLAQGTQSISDLIKSGWHTVERSERFSSRMFRAGIDAVKSGKTGELYNPQNWLEGWRNAEFATASFTTASKETAADLLGNEEHFNIMMSLRRYGDAEEGLVEYFMAQGNSHKDAMNRTNEFLASGITVSSEWIAAGEALDAGTTNAMQYAMDGWEEMVYDVPQYMGGLRGQPDAPLSDAAGFWTKGHAIAGFTAEMVGSIAFDPLNAVDIYFVAARAARPGVRAGNWAAQVDRYHHSAATLRALENAENLLKNGEEIITAGRGSRITNGMLIDAEKGAGKNFKEWAKATAKKEDFGLEKYEPITMRTRRSLEELNAMVDHINDAFRQHNDWARRATEAAGRGEIFREADPALTLLTDLNPLFMDAYPQMLQYHSNAQWGPFGGVDGADDGAELLTSRPGLDSYDGVWDFWKTAAGPQVLGGNLLGGYQGDKIFIPRLGHAARTRLRLAGLKRSLLGKGTRFDEAGGIWAETFSSWMATNTDVTINSLHGKIQDAIKNPALFPQSENLSDAAKNLSKYDLQKLISDGDLQAMKLLRETHPAYQGLTVNDIDLLNQMNLEESAKSVKQLQGIYEHVQVNRSLDDLPEELVLSDEIMEVLETRWPDISESFAYFEDTPGPRVVGGEVEGFGHPNFWAQGVNYVRNRRLGYLHEAGSTEALLLQKFPERIVRTGTKTWEELLQMGYDVGPYRIDMKQAGYNNPNELLAAIDEFSIKEVAEQIKIKPSELKWFLKNRIHTAVSENKFYDITGKIKDTALISLYTGALTPFKVHEMLFKNVPKKQGFINVTGLGPLDAGPIKEFQRWIDMGIKTGMPRSTIDLYISDFVHGDEARRMSIIQDVVTEWLGRSGAMQAGGHPLKASWDEFVRGSDMIYGNTGADQFLSRGRMIPRAISPAVAKEGMISQAVTVPDWTELGEMTKYMGYMRYLGYTLGRPQIDHLVRKTWVPLALFKFGLAPRNAIDELLIATMNHGPGFYLDAKASRIATNQGKIFDAYGNRILMDKDTPIGIPEIVTDSETYNKQVKELQASYEAAVNYTQRGTNARDLAIARPVLWAWKNLMDMFGMGRGQTTNRKALDKAKARFQGQWDEMSGEGKMLAFLEAASDLGPESIRRTSQPATKLRALEDMAESLSHQVAGRIHAGIQALPSPIQAIGIAPYNETAARFLRRNEGRDLHGMMLLLSHNFTASPHLEGVLAPFRSYYDITQRPFAAERLMLGQGPVDPGLIDWLPLDYSESALAWRFPKGTGDDILTDLQAASQHIDRYWQAEPIFREMGTVLAYNTQAITLGRFDNILKEANITVADDLELTTTQNSARSVRYVYDLTEDMRGTIRDLYTATARNMAGQPWYASEAFFPSKINGETIEWTLDSALGHLVKNTPNNELKKVLKAIRKSDPVARMQTLALLSIRNLDSRKFDINSSVLYEEAVRVGKHELMTIDGKDRLHSMVRTNGVDPAYKQMQRPTTPENMRLYHPQVNAAEAMSLAYMFTNADSIVGQEMFDSLKEFLTFYLESEPHAVSVINSLNPMNNPHGSVTPAAWLRADIPDIHSAIGPGGVAGSSKAVHAAVQGFLANSSTSLQKGIPLLVGSHDPLLSKNVGLAIRRWHSRMGSDANVPIEGLAEYLKASTQTAEDVVLQSRTVSRAEYRADPGFGQTIGVTAGSRHAASNISAPRMTPPRVFVQGDQWMHVEDMPTRWERVPDESGTGRGQDIWQLNESLMGGDDPGVRQIMEKRLINRREYIEEQIMNTIRGFATLPDQSIVQYFYSPSMKGDPLYKNVYQSYYESVPSGSLAPSYDVFGARMERIVDLFNEFSDGTRTWGEFEDAVWRRFGDAPITAKKGIGPSISIDHPADIIGTVGDGPIGQHGFRRIFHEYAENDVIPNRKLIKEPLGDINDFPGRDKLPHRRWLGEQMQTGGGSLGKKGRRGRAYTDPEGTVGINEVGKVEFGDPELEGTLQEYQRTVESFTPEQGQPLSPVAKEFFEWRQGLLNERLQSQGIDTVWPFWERPRGASVEEIIPPTRLSWEDVGDDPEKLSEFNAQVLAEQIKKQNAEAVKNRIPAFFQETRNTAEARGVPINTDVMGGGEVSPVGRLVRAQLNNFPKSEMPGNLWRHDPMSGRSVRPGDIGGFDKNDNPFVAVNALTMGRGFERVGGAGSFRLQNMWRHTNTGDFIWLPDGMETEMQSLRGLNSRQIVSPDTGPPIVSADPSIIPSRNTDALLDIGGAEIEHHKGIIDVPFEMLDSEIASMPPSPIDPNFRSRKGKPEVPQYNLLDVKKTVTVLDHQYEALIAGDVTGFAVPPKTRGGSSGFSASTEEGAAPLKSRRGQHRGGLADKYNVAPEVKSMTRSGGSGPLTNVSVGDLLEVRPRAAFRPKPGQVEQALIEAGRLEGAKRGRDTTSGGAGYPMKVTKMVSASKLTVEEFAEIVMLPVKEVKENWTSGSNFSRYKVAMLERIEGTSGWQKSHLSIDDVRKDSPRTRVMGDEGTSYFYTGKNFVAQPWSPMVAAIRDRVEQITGYKFDLVIAQRYESGRTTLGPHYDSVGTSSTPESIVVSVNFGETRHFQFRPRRGVREGERVGEGTGQNYKWTDRTREQGPTIELDHGDILAMMEGTNANWEHQIIGSSSTEPRINLTFRRMDPQIQKQVRFEAGPEPISTPSTHSSGLTRIISGGQNGADEAGLLAAQELGIPTGGTATYRWDTTLGPKPEQAEQFGLVADTKDFPKAGSRYGSRTRQNIVNSDGTVLFSENITDTGSAMTVNIAEQLKKPLHHVSGTSDKAIAAFVKWLEDNNIRTLNVAGNRLWTAPGKLRRKEDFQDRVHQFLLDALRGTDDVPAAGTPVVKKTMAMSFIYGETPYVKNLGRAAHVTTDSTFDAIVAGERTATTRAVKGGKGELENVEVGDIIEFQRGGDKVKVRVTGKRQPKEITPEEWSRLEGYGAPPPGTTWTDTGPWKKFAGQRQITYELVDDVPAAAPPAALTDAEADSMWHALSTGEREVIEADYRAAFAPTPGRDPAVDGPSGTDADLMYERERAWKDQQYSGYIPSETPTKAPGGYGITKIITGNKTFGADNAGKLVAEKIGIPLQVGKLREAEGIVWLGGSGDDMVALQTSAAEAGVPFIANPLQFEFTQWMDDHDIHVLGMTGSESLDPKWHGEAKLFLDDALYYLRRGRIANPKYKLDVEGAYGTGDMTITPTAAPTAAVPEPIPAEMMRWWESKDAPPAAAPTAAETGPVKVWAGTGSANVILSNIYDIPNGFFFRGKRFKSPEAAYQAYKSGKGYDKSQKWTELSGWHAKRAGRGRRVDTADGSPTNSKLLMREIVAARLIQDPDFMKALTATGDRKIVHPSADIWETEYPRILTENRAKAQEVIDSDTPSFGPPGKSLKEEMNDGEWELAEQQHISEFDESNAAETFARTSLREMLFLATNEQKAARSARAESALAGGEPSALQGMATDLPGAPIGGPDNHYSWLLEAIDPPGGVVDSSRIVAVHDDEMVPRRISGKSPVVASSDPLQWFEDTKRSFFENLIQPAIGAMIREPLFTHNFNEARRLMAGYRHFSHHSIDYFKGLEQILQTPSSSLLDEFTKEPWTGARPVLRLVDDSGKPQWKLVDESSEVADPSLPKKSGVTRSSFDDFLEYGYKVYSQAELVKTDPLSSMAHLMNQYFDGIQTPDEIIERMFYLDRRQVYNEVTDALDEVWDAGPFFQAFGPSTRGSVEGAEIVMGEGYEGFFRAMQVNHPQDYVRMKKSILELMGNRIQTEVKHVELAIERAANVTALFVDNHAVRSQFQEMVGTAIPFHFAMMQFMQRWGRTLKHHPNSLSKINWGLLAAQRSGLIYEDERGDQRVMIPGSELLTRMMYEHVGNFPVVRALFGDMTSLIDTMGMKTQNLSPGYNLDNIANASVGPLIAVPANLMGMLDPMLTSDEWMGPSLVSKWAFMAEDFDPTTEQWDQQSFFNILFGSIIPAPIASVGGYITAVVASEVFGSGSTGLDKALFDATFMLANANQLPNPQEMGVLTEDQTNLITEDALNSFVHIAKQLLLTRVLSGWFTMTAIEPTSLTDPDDHQWNEKFQRLIDEGGMPHEEAFSQMYEEYYEEFVEKQTAAGVTDVNEINALWQHEILKISVFTTGKTGKDTIAALPSTVAAYEWMDTDEAREFLNTFEKTGGFFIPRGLTEESREHDVRATARYLATEMRYRREPEDYIREIYENEGAIEYYRKSMEAKELMAQYRGARDKGERNYVNPEESWAQTISTFELEYKVWKDQFKKLHPVFAATLAEQHSKPRRDATLEEMVLLINDPSLIPDAPHKADILGFMGDIVTMNSRLMQFTNMQNSMATEGRNSIKAQYYNNWSKEISKAPWLFELYYNLFIPLISEDWIVKYKFGTHEMGQ